MSCRDSHSTVDRQLELATAVHDLRNRLGVAGCEFRQLRSTLVSTSCNALVGEALASVEHSLTQTNTELEALLELLGDQIRIPASCTRGIDLVTQSRRFIEENLVVQRNRVQLRKVAPRVFGPWSACRINTVLHILLDNALRYSPMGGLVTVDVAAELGWASIVVQDIGVGIPAEDLPHVCEPFFRARNVDTCTSGLGLGLATARLIVEQYAGVLEVNSTDEAGTTLTARLPLVASCITGPAEPHRGRGHRPTPPAGSDRAN